MSITFKAIVKNGLLQPLEPLDLPEDQIVDLEIVSENQAGNIVKLEGAWSGFLDEQSLSYEEIQAITHDAQLDAIKRSAKKFAASVNRDDDLET